MKVLKILKNPAIIQRFVIGKAKYIPYRYLLILMSIVVGLIAGLAAVTLKTTVHYTEILFTKGIDKVFTFDVAYVNYLYLAYPLIGILLTVLYVRTFIKEDIGHGISKILYAISKKSGIMKRHNMYSSVIACTFTGSFGGSVGMEAPIVSTGASIGSNVGQMMRMNYKTTILMIACGATGAMAGIFKAPLAALIFSLEVLMLDLTLSSIIPLLMASVSGALVSNLLLGNQIVFYFSLKDGFNVNHLPFYLLLGIIAGLVSVYFSRILVSVEQRYHDIKNPYRRLLLGGISLGVLIFLFPPLYGEGYIAMKSLLGGNAGDLLNNSFFYALKDNLWFFLAFLVLILIFKVIATAVTTGSGGIGGIFAPTLFMGGLTGFIVAKIVNSTGIVHLSESNFALVGMAGLIAGVIHAPLTAIFLIAEITSGYELFMPLMVTSAISYATILYFEPHSIYTKRLAQRGELVTHHKDKAVLSRMSLGNHIETDFPVIRPDMNLGELVKTMAQSHRTVFPVVDSHNTLLGTISLDQNNVRQLMFDHEMYETTLASSLMVMPESYVSSTDGMEDVVKKFEEAVVWILPVIDNGKYVGFVVKSKLFSVYRKLLKEFYED